MICHACGDQWPDTDGLEAIANHLRLHHPHLDVAPERWPDGGLVVVDTTLEPGDFGDGAS